MNILHFTFPGYR